MSNQNKLYCDVYKSICQQQQVPINKAIIQALKGQELQLNASQMGINDIIPLQFMMSICQFDALALYGRERPKTSKRDQKSANDVQKILNGIIQSVNIGLLQENCNLIHLSIVDITLGIKECQLLGQGILKNQTLKELLIQNCNLSAAHLQTISEPIQQCQNLIVLDLSGNKLKDHAGALIGKIISIHSVRRDELKWAEEIRGGTRVFQILVAPNTISLQGICEVSLHNNLFDDKCIRDLSQFLQYDGWTKSIGLRGNLIETEGIDLLNRVLDTNESLISLDLRDNPGFKIPLSKEIFDKLVRNIRLFKQNKISQSEVEEQVSLGLDNQFEEDVIDNPMGQIYNQYQNEPIEEMQMEEEQEEPDDQMQVPSDYQELQQVCQKLQSQNLKLQYENVNLNMQIKQLQQQLSQNNSQSQLREDDSEPEALVPKIEYMMGELSRLMDLLEQKGGSQQLSCKVLPKMKKAKKTKSASKKSSLNQSR